MVDTIIKSFDVWTGAQGVKSKGRVRSIENISMEGIARLRELILELAVRGKLVPQDENDEPASELIKRIEEEKTKLIADGNLRNEKPLPKIKDEEKPFELPKGWAWIRLGNITNKIGSGSTPRGGQKAYVDSGILFLRSQNIRNEGVLLDDVAYIDNKTNEKMSNTSVLYNDILLNITGGSLGRSAIFKQAETTANVSQHVTIIRPAMTLSSEFLHKTILSPYVQELIWGRQVGANREGLSKKILELFEFPLPPLAEQHRIVAKVDELMALCDKLEQEQTANLKTHQTLVKALLQTLTDAKDADAVAAAWQRLSPHFDTLFCTEDSIEQLKQTILQLAIMGRLVRQDPNDEPASELIKRIEKEKGKMIVEGKMKKEKALTKIGDEEKAFELPRGWECVRLEQLATRIDYGTSEKATQTGDIPILRMGNIQDGEIVYQNLKYVPKTIKELPFLFLKNGDLVFNRTNSYELVGKCGIFNGVDDEYTLASYLIRVSFPLQLLSVQYINYYVNSNTCRQTQIEPNITQQTGQANFSGGKLKQVQLPFPPLAEQLRIVTKVDELMALCNNLNASILNAEEVKVQLSVAVVEAAVG